MHKKIIGAAAFVVFTFDVSAASAESWNCQLAVHNGLWQTDGADLIGPAMRYTIVRDTPDVLVGLSEGRRIEMVVLNRRSWRCRRWSWGWMATAARATPAAAPALTPPAPSPPPQVRPLIRSLARQAQNLASQGYTTAANLKLVEAEASAA